MSHLSNAAGAMAAVAETITADQLAERTPCTDYDVRGLVNHLLFWAPSLAAAGRKEIVPPPAATESDVDLTSGDWHAVLLADLDDMVSSWAPESAWAGETRFVGPTMPAAAIGDMIISELAVHAWDLAAATGQKLDLPDDTLSYLLPSVAANAEQGREMGLFGPEVTVAAEAPPLDRVLGLTGRDPAWT
ncbi:TIGR03086 family metal-binding protein [Actinophytocola oryzae]|uniref:Uncharacterized protein (TIGR03086 family) n=1 Tax=Actinophytocola oryzae TaxID=502181 RepID=A0A4R7VR45_9PSEU|nr:TIGR03086 family metal-binding protein [Actinophytocola oryzae]TDV51925.1 uncharacterized protein (TIGR03086 family) [Actinophytocola oryzae]